MHVTEGTRFVGGYLAVLWAFVSILIQIMFVQLLAMHHFHWEFYFFLHVRGVLHACNNGRGFPHPWPWTWQCHCNCSEIQMYLDAAGWINILKSKVGWWLDFACGEMSTLSLLSFQWIINSLDWCFLTLTFLIWAWLWFNFMEIKK